MKQCITLPPDVYDTLEFACEVYGGVGAKRAWAHGEQPHCILAYLHWLGLRDIVPEAFASFWENDRAVQAINDRLGLSDQTCRVPWNLYCAERKIRRV